LRQGFVKGTLTLQRAASETSITAYNIYWRHKDGTRGPFVSSVPAYGFQEPSCSGATCSLIESSRLAEGASRDTYTDSEQAVISASGPGSITVTHLDTEQSYDTLLIGDQELSGNMTETLPLTLTLGEVPVQIKWTSDGSVHSNGWSFELRQTNSMVTFEVPSVVAAGTGFEVVPTYKENELPAAAVFLDVIDYTNHMKVSPAFAPVALSFLDEDGDADSIAGTAVVFPAPDAQGLEFYRVALADAEGKLLNRGWTAHVSSSTGNVTIEVPATGLPKDAARLVVHAGNSFGFGDGFASLALVDTQPRGPIFPGSDEQAPLPKQGGDRRLADTVVGVPGAKKAPRSKKADQQQSEPWLHQSASKDEEAKVIWAESVVAPLSEAAAKIGRVRSSFTVPGLDAQALGGSEGIARRAGLARGLAAELGAVAGEARVRVVRVAVVGVAANVEFEVEPSASASAGTLDYVEAHLILLSNGGKASANFDQAFTSVLASLGVKPADASKGFTARFGTTQQLGPKLLAANKKAGVEAEGSGGRRLRGVVAGDDIWFA